MTYLQGVILALLQGITEFLPVSSSGHLVALRELLGWGDEQGILVDVMLHAASLLAILIYFHRQWIPLVVSVIKWHDPMRRESRRYTGLLIAATVPILLVGPWLESGMDQLRHGAVVGGLMIALGIWYFVCERLRRNELPGMTFQSAVAMGLTQVLALLPGISRSGITISTGVLTGQSHINAARFSFLMVVPPILGASLLEARHLTALEPGAYGPLCLSFVVCFFACLASIHFCLSLFRRISLVWFGFYLVAFGVVLIAARLVQQ